MHILHMLQATVEDLQGVSIDLDVEAYVIDPQTWRAIPEAREGLPEQLIVREYGDEVELALYIAPQIMEQLERDDPHTALHAGNLESYCVALEGVSHFVYLTSRAQAGQQVSALDMELQAEVEKFVATWLLLADQGRPLNETAHVLVARLFDHYELHPAVPDEDVSRYHLASRAAHNFCGRLARRYGRDKTSRRIKDAVRAFSRRRLAEKLRAA